MHSWSNLQSFILKYEWVCFVLLLHPWLQTNWCIVYVSSLFKPKHLSVIIFLSNVVYFQWSAICTIHYNFTMAWPGIWGKIYDIIYKYHTLNVEYSKLHGIDYTQQQEHLKKHIYCFILPTYMYTIFFSTQNIYHALTFIYISTSLTYM